MFHIIDHSIQRAYHPTCCPTCARRPCRIWSIFRQRKSKFTDAPVDKRRRFNLRQSFCAGKLSVKIAAARPRPAGQTTVWRSEQPGLRGPAWCVANESRKHRCVIGLWANCHTTNAFARLRTDELLLGERAMRDMESLGRSLRCYDDSAHRCSSSSTELLC